MRDDTERTRNTEAVRVIAGHYKGHRLRAPKRGVRPTGDRVREAIFSALGSVEGDRVLDLFAGTGALGIESLSRGAARVVFVERARGALQCLRANLAALEIPASAGGVAEVLACDAANAIAGWAATASRGLGADVRRFDLVFLDPPYEQGDVQASLDALVQAAVLAPDARLVIEMAKREPQLRLAQQFRLISERDYGDTRIVRLSHERDSTPAHA